jgi:hypothetical protein
VERFIATIDFCAPSFLVLDFLSLFFSGCIMIIYSTAVEGGGTYFAVSVASCSTAPIIKTVDRLCVCDGASIDSYPTPSTHDADQFLSTTSALF